MNNRELYKEAMSGIRPSPLVIERILDMTETKKKYMPKKGLVAVLVIISLFIIGCVTANAATDGAVAEYISNSVRVFINGKEIDADIIKAENGENKIVLKESIPVPDGDAEVVIVERDEMENDVWIDIQSDENGVEIVKNSDTIIEADGFYEPTTAVLESE